MKVVRKELEIFEISEPCMAEWVKAIIKKKWFAAEKLDGIRSGEKHQNEGMGAALMGTCSKLESPHLLKNVVDAVPERDININNRETIETIMRKR